MTPRTSADSLADTIAAARVPDALAHTNHITDPAPETGATVRDVELLEGGEHQGEDYGDDDLEDLVANWNRANGLIETPAVIGHEEYQPLTQHADWQSPIQDLPQVVSENGHHFMPLGKNGFNTGNPAIGWLKNVRLEIRPNRIGRPRKVVLADVENLPWKLADIIRRKAYGKISPEFWDTPPEGAPPDCKGLFLRRAAFMGGETPQIKTLNDFYDLVSAEPLKKFSDRPVVRASLHYLGRHRTNDGGWRMFSEVQVMPENASRIGEAEAPEHTAERTATMDQLKGVNGMPQEMLADLASLPNDQFQKMAQHLLKMSPGWAQPGGRTAEPTAPGSHFSYSDTSGVDDNDWISRNAGKTCAKMGDDVLPGGDPGMMADKLPPTDLPPDPGNMPLETLQMPPTADVGNQTMGANPLMPPNPDDRQPPNLPAPMHQTMADMKRFADQVTRNVKAELNAIATARVGEERRSQILPLLDQAVRDKRITSGQADPRSRNPNWYHRLVQAAGSPRLIRFGDRTLSDWDYAVYELRSLPKINRFSSDDRIKDPDQAARTVSGTRRNELLAKTSVGRDILKREAKK